jgi:archaellum biogenesis ATPase FlaH
LSKIIQSGFKSIDEALGGGLIEGGFFLINYDKNSLGWVLGLKMVKKLLDQGATVLIANMTLPVSKLELRCNYVGLDIQKEGKKGNLFIIDLFGSKYRIHENKPYIYQIEDWEDETAYAKLGEILKSITTKLPKDKPLVTLLATLEGAYLNFGEYMLVKLVRGWLMVAEKFHAQEATNILLLNRDAVPERIEAWLISISDQVVEFISKLSSAGLEEIITIPKSLIPGFVPTHYTIRLSKEKIIDMW